MSHTPHTPSPPVQVIVQKSESNGIGMAGFICSLISLFTCGILFPIGFLLSLIGVFFRPRGFAIAGLVISGGSMALLVLSWFLFLGALLGFGAMVSNLIPVQEIAAAKSAIENSPQIQAKIGSPVKCEFSHQHQPDQQADFAQHVTVEGPQGSGEGEIKLTFNPETLDWTTTSIQVTIDGEVIDLTSSTEH